MCLYLRWLICCPKVALGGKNCSKLLGAQKVSQNSNSCQKVAEHNLYWPSRETVESSIVWDFPDISKLALKTISESAPVEILKAYSKQITLHRKINCTK